MCIFYYLCLRFFHTMQNVQKMRYKSTHTDENTMNAKAAFCYSNQATFGKDFLNGCFFNKCLCISIIRYLLNVVFSHNAACSTLQRIRIRARSTK